MSKIEIAASEVAGQLRLDVENQGRRVSAEISADEAYELGVGLLRAGLGPDGADFPAHEARPAPQQLQEIPFALEG